MNTSKREVVMMGILLVLVLGLVYWFFIQEDPAEELRHAEDIMPLVTITEADKAGLSTGAKQKENASTQDTKNTARPQPVVAQGEKGEKITATPLAQANTWQFVVGGKYVMLQDSYGLDYGDGTQDFFVKCAVSSSDDPYCLEFGPIQHTYTKSGVYTVKLISTSNSAGLKGPFTLLTFSLPVASAGDR